MTQSQSSQEVAEQVMECRTWTKGIGLVDHETVAIALIEAWVSAREAKVQYEEAAWWAERKTRTATLDETESYRLEVLRKRESAILRMQPAGEANDRQGGGWPK